jgi:hypothetical protein
VRGIGWWIGVGMVVVTVLAATPSSAVRAEGVATMTAVEQEHLAELAQWAYRNGATDAGPDCGTVCTDLWLSEHRPMPNQATSAELWSELNTLEEAGTSEGGIALLPDLSVAVPYVFLGAGAFTLGWKIGGKIDKWLGIGVPAPPTPQSAFIVWYSAGSAEPFPSYHTTMTMPYSGYAIQTSSLGGVVAQTAAAVCDSPEPPSFPSEFDVVHWWWNDCFTGYGLPLLPVTAWGLVLKPDATFATPIEDYAGQSYTAGTAGVRDPGVEVVEARLAEALETGRYPILNQWLDHGFGGSSEDPLCEPVEGAGTIAVPAIMPGETVTDYEDCLDTLGLTEHVRVTVPVGQAVLAQPARGVVSVEPDEGTSIEPETQVQIKINPDPLPDAEALDETEECHLSSGEYPVGPPSNDPTPRAFDQISDSSLVSSATFVSSEGNTMLRWGTTSPVFRGEELDFDGWGYQHIKAKHGWSRADDAATRSALLNRAIPSGDVTDSYYFIGPEYQQGGVECVREVLANFAAAEGDPAPKGIITSYGRNLNDLPGFMRPGN